MKRHFTVPLVSKKLVIFLFMVAVIVVAGCAAMKTQISKDTKVTKDLQAGRYSEAAQRIEQFRQQHKYQKKDRVLYYLDKGAVLHYDKKWSDSNNLLEAADRAMEELFTKSISKAAASMLLNDNVLDYYGEVYENLYVNIFKALNYLKLNRFDDAYVEIKRVNDKLVLLDDKYGKLVEEMNRADTSGIQIEKKAVKFYNDAIAHYLSYLIFRAEGEYDNSRISYEKMQSAWDLHPEVYDHPIPSFLNQKPDFDGTKLNIVAFTGNAPYKAAVGGKITTYDSLIHVSDLSGYKQNLILPFPGVKQGYHFKFAFPEIRMPESNTNRIEVYVDNQLTGELELLEDMGKVAQHTFAAKKNIIYFKTLIRTVLKGLASARAKEKLRKKAGAEDNFLLGALINLGVDAAVDATENPDLRSWRTMPRYCFTGEVKISPGLHHIEIRLYNTYGVMVEKKEFPNYQISNGLNLVEAVYLN